MLLSNASKCIQYLADAIIFVNICHEKVRAIFGPELLFVFAVSCSALINY